MYSLVRLFNLSFLRCDTGDENAVLNVAISDSVGGRIAIDSFTLADGGLTAGEWVELKICGVVPADSDLIGTGLYAGVWGQYVHVDNLRLTVGNHPCEGCYAANDPTMAEGDLDDDCDVDLVDFATMAAGYLKCGNYPECLTGW